MCSCLTGYLGLKGNPPELHIAQNVMCVRMYDKDLHDHCGHRANP